MTERTNYTPRPGRYAAEPSDQPVAQDAAEQHAVLGTTEHQATSQWSEQAHTADLTRRWDSGELPVVDHDEAPTAGIRPVREAQPHISDNTDTVLTRGAHLRARLGASTGVWIGLALVAAGFVAIFYSWTKVAGLVNVALQMPYLVSGGITGLALVIVGVTVVDVAVRRQDSHERTQQMTQINRILTELHDLLEEDEAPTGDQYWDEKR